VLETVTLESWGKFHTASSLWTPSGSEGSSGSRS